MEIMDGTAIESSPTRLSMRRAFLCDASSTHAPADRAAQFCIAGVGQDAPTLDASGAIDLSRTLVVLPGSRARRLFLRALSEAVGNHPLIPPETTTVGGAEALLFDAPITVASTTRVAPSSVERLAWAHVLSDPRAAILLHQVEGAAPLNLAQRFDAARVVLSAISELDKALLTAEGVAEVAAKLGENELAARWCAIDELSIDVGAWLKKRGFHAACSPRARAWGAPSGMFDRVVLVGLAEVRPSLRHALRTSNADVVACVFATEVDASRFDAYGVPDDSFAAPLAFEPIELAPCADIADLTERLVAWVSDAVDGPVHAAAEDFTFAMVDESMAQPVARMCESHGLSLHLAEGTPLAMTLVGRLVIDLDRAFSEQSSNAATALVNALDSAAYSPSFDLGFRARRVRSNLVPCAPKGMLAKLADEIATVDPASDPYKVITALCALQKPTSIAHTAKMSSLDLLGEILAPAFVELRARKDASDVERTAAVLLFKQLDQLRVDFSTLQDDCTSLLALSLLTDFVLTQSVPMESNDASIETVGWLELPFDPAARIALIGVHAGALPGNTNEFGLLPARLRERLSLTTLATRRARDGFILSQVQARVGNRVSQTATSGAIPNLLLLCPRVDIASNPLLPSPLIFGGNAAHLAAQAVRFFDEEARAHEPHCTLVHGTAARTQSVALQGAFDPLPPVRAYPADKSIRATDFKSYLDCPYRWHLSRAESLYPLRASDYELDEAGFGTVLHEVIAKAFPAQTEEAFNDARALSIEQVCARLLEPFDGVLRDNGIDADGAGTHFQCTEMRRRLAALAHWQHAAFAVGWRIVAVETSFDAELELADGTTTKLSGRIDRISYNAATHTLCIHDFKTFDNIKKTADKDHATFSKGVFQDGTWKNLQLPLYRALGTSSWASLVPLIAEGRELGIDVGYIILPAGGKTFESLATWPLASDASAVVEAKRIALLMRSADPQPLPESIAEEWDSYRTVCRATIVKSEDAFAANELEAEAGADASEASDAAETSTVATEDAV